MARLTVCNARTGIRTAAAIISDDEWSTVIAVTLSGYFNVTRSAGGK
ncbi:hypothetical protein [Mesorhizobium sp. M1A.F.Ca.ET.072.01.1.1]|nr:hypothetical protein [Mesorhizobium sp. M1A.F.Ca.ET.072.01.1.1]